MLTSVWRRITDSPGPLVVINPTDAELVKACLAGSRDSFDTIVERHQRQVYQLCFRFVGNHADASDLAQDVFVRAYRGLHRFKGDASLGTWLYRIAVNVCLNRVTARRLATAPIDEQRLVSHAESPSDLVLREERAGRVRAAIARLPRKQRATLILRMYHELPHDQTGSDSISSCAHARTCADEGAGTESAHGSSLKAQAGSGLNRKP